MAFGTVEHGWCVGENAVQHGMDLRWFIKPGFDDKTVCAAVRYSDYACIGRGLSGNGVHGGAIESALDETTAECAKTKLFPLATTYSVEFKLKQRIVPNVTYRVHASVEKEHVKNIKCALPRAARAATALPWL